jgi:hypothetical protein
MAFNEASVCINKNSQDTHLQQAIKQRNYIKNGGLKMWSVSQYTQGNE